MLQAEDGDWAMAPQPGVKAGAGEAWAGGSRETSWMCTGEREKRRCSRDPEVPSGTGEEQQVEGVGKKLVHPLLGVSQRSQGKPQGRGESEDSARLKNVGLEEECREEDAREELGPWSGTDPALDASPAAPPPLWQRRLTGIQILEALGRQGVRQRDRSSGTDRERQWRLGGGGGGGGELWKNRSVTEVQGTGGLKKGSPLDSEPPRASTGDRAEEASWLWFLEENTAQLLSGGNP